jgi:hypothetical protein
VDVAGRSAKPVQGVEGVRLQTLLAFASPHVDLGELTDRNAGLREIHPLGDRFHARGDQLAVLGGLVGQLVQSGADLTEPLAVLFRDVVVGRVAGLDLADLRLDHGVQNVADQIGPVHDGPHVVGRAAWRRGERRQEQLHTPADQIGREVRLLLGVTIGLGLGARVGRARVRAGIGLQDQAARVATGVGGEHETIRHEGRTDDQTRDEIAIQHCRPCLSIGKTR